MIRRGIGVQSFVAAGGAGTDADAQAFITAAGITDATQQSAINTLVTDLKGYGIWSKMKALYPFVGGTSSTHKWNLKDPRDLDAAFRLVFNGGWTHSSTGAKPNGTNGYGDTKLAPSVVQALNNTHISFYSRLNLADGDDLSCYNGVISRISRLLIKDSSSNIIADMNDTTQRITLANADARGFYVVNRTTSTSLKLHKNSSIIGTNTNANTGTLPSFAYSIGALNNQNAYVNFSARECAFVSIGDGLTDAEAANFYTAVQAYQTTLSRNV